MAQDQNVLRDSLRVMLLRDLRALAAEITAYPDDDSVWKVVPGISNSAGTLTLHLTGNLRHFIGAVLGGSGYVRNRDAEFSTRGLSRADLQVEIRTAITELDKALDKISATQLAGAYPLPIRDRQVRTSDWLVHLAVHLGYHLGQVDYHRRILTPNPKAVECMALGDIPAA
jgi:uncharacterized damage-inducible protein DinB